MLHVRTNDADLSFNHLGTFALMKPNTRAASDWLADYWTGELVTFRGAIVVDDSAIPSLVTDARRRFDGGGLGYA